MELKNILILVLVLIGGIGLIFATGLFSVTDVTGVKGDYINVPSYGFLKCDESSNKVSFPKDTEYQVFSQLRFQCDQLSSGLVQECDITLKQPEGGTTGKYAGLQWKICTKGQICSEYVPDNQIKYVEILYFTQNSELGQEYNIHLESHQYLIAEYGRSEGLFSGNLLYEPKGRWKVSYKPWFVYLTDQFDVRTGQAVSEDGCIFPERPPQADAIITGVSGGGKLEKTLPVATSTSLISLRGREVTIPYVSKIVPIMPQYNMFDDGNKYCTNKKIYAVERIDTPIGWYRVANTGTNKELETVECCNTGDAISTKGAGYYCTKDFKIEKLGTGDIQCSAAIPCPVVGFQPVPGKKVVFQECINNKCVDGEIGVACYYHEDCPNGYCQRDTANPKNNKCVYKIPPNFCGNGVCDASYGEDYNSCPSDCEPPPPPFNVVRFLIILGLSILGTIISLLFIGGKLKPLIRNKNARIIVIIIIGLIVFLMLFLIIGWVIKLLVALWGAITRFVV